MFCEDQNTSMTWPSVLPTGWSMKWEPSSTSDDFTEWYRVWAYHDIYPTTVVYSSVSSSAAELLSYTLLLWNFSSFLWNKTCKSLSFGLLASKLWCKVHSYLCAVIYCGIVVCLTRLYAGCILVLRSDIKWFHRDITRQTNGYTGWGAFRCLVHSNWYNSH